MDLLQINQELHSQIEEGKQRFQDLNEKFLVSEATAYSLANQLQKYQCGKHKEIIESVLGEKLHSKEGELAEKLMLTEKLRESKILIEDQAQELSQLRKKFQEGREMSLLLSQHLWQLLTQKDSGSPQGQDFFDLLMEGQRLADCLILKLSPESHKDEYIGKERESLVSRLSTEEQEEEEEVKEALQEPLDEGHETSSSHCVQPSCSSADFLDENDTLTSLDATQSPGNQKQEEEKLSMDTSMELQVEKEMEEEFMDFLDEKYLALPSFHDMSYACQHPKIPASLSEEHVGYFTPGLAKLILDALLRMRNPPKLEGETIGGLATKTPGFQMQGLLDAASVHRQIIKGKLRFNKCKLACRFPGLQASELSLDVPSVKKNPVKLEDDATDGSIDSKHGHHVIGHIDDYSAPKQMISEAKQRVQKIQSLMKPACNFLGTEAPGNKGVNDLWSSISVLKHTLEESVSLLNTFWPAPLPSSNDLVLPGKVVESMEREFLELRALVSKQKRLLHYTIERLKNVSQQKENMEQFIISQLSRTQDVLKKARSNLELRKQLHLLKPHNFPPSHYNLSSDLMLPSLMLSKDPGDIQLSWFLKADTFGVCL